MINNTFHGYEIELFGFGDDEFILKRPDFSSKLEEKKFNETEFLYKLPIKEENLELTKSTYCGLFHINIIIDVKDYYNGYITDLFYYFSDFTDLEFFVIYVSCIYSYKNENEKYYYLQFIFKFNRNIEIDILKNKLTFYFLEKNINVILIEYYKLNNENIKDIFKNISSIFSKYSVLNYNYFNLPPYIGIYRFNVNDLCLYNLFFPFYTDNLKHKESLNEYKYYIEYDNDIRLVNNYLIYESKLNNYNYYYLFNNIKLYVDDLVDIKSYEKIINLKFDLKLIDNIIPFLKHVICKVERSSEIKIINILNGFIEDD